MEYNENIIVTENTENAPKTDDDAVMNCRGIKTEALFLNLSVDVVDDEIIYPILSRSQAHWLSIGENFGAWLVRKITKSKASNFFGL